MPSPIIEFLVNNYQLLLILPMILAFKAESQYVSRVSTVTNTIGMFVAMAPHWDATRSWLMISGIPVFHLYLLIGLAFGAIAFLTYMLDVSASSEFYWATWLFFNSAIGIAVCFVATLL